MAADLPLARRDAILSRLAHGEPVVAAALAAEFAISEDAIRRDLRALAAQGLCRRVYGGALPLVPGSTAIGARIGADRERKRALARAAARLIRPGELVFLDSGSTNLALAEILPEDLDLVVATNSIPIAAELLPRQDLRLILVGGTVDPVVGGCVDAAAVLGVAALNIDRCFLGACAVEPAAGVSAFEAGDATFKRALLAASRHGLVLATSDKLGARAPHRLAPLDRLDRLIVEHDAEPALLAALAHAGARILQAEPAT
ncbi:MAG: DeoR/GlpR family DNA-binding transcription regulator [Geminicoccaceae bacterium]